MAVNEQRSTPHGKDRMRERIAVGAFLFHIVTFPVFIVMWGLAMFQAIDPIGAMDWLVIFCIYISAFSMMSMRFIMGFHDGMQVAWIPFLGYAAVAPLVAPIVHWFVWINLFALALGIVVHPSPWWGPFAKERGWHTHAPEQEASLERSRESFWARLRRRFLTKREAPTRALQVRESLAMGAFMGHLVILPWTFYLVTLSIQHFASGGMVIVYAVLSLLAASSLLTARFVMGYHDGKQMAWLPAIGYVGLFAIVPTATWDTLGLTLALLLLGVALHPAPWWGPFARRRGWPLARSDRLERAASD